MAPDKRKHEELIDWEICFICQIPDDEKLRCPANNVVNEKDGSEVYTKIASNIKKLSDFNNLPQAFIPISILEDDNDLKDILCKNKASWHRKCFRLFDDERVERALIDCEKINTESSKSTILTPTSPVKTRKKSKSLSLDEVKNICCLFCDCPAYKKNNLCQVMTLEVNNKVKLYANDLQDFKIIAKITHGDIIASEKKYHPQCLATFYNRWTSHKLHSSKEVKNDNNANTIFF
jgi:hypothetical protein